MGRKLIFSFLYVMLVFFVLVTASVAWFVTTDNNKAYNMTVHTTTELLDVQAVVYKYDADTDKYVDVTELPDAYILNQYDSVITERNVNTALVVQLTVSGNAIIQHKQLFCKLSCTEVSKTSHYISNITYTDLQFADGTDIDSICKAFNTTIVNKKSWVQTNKETEINYIIDNYVVDNDRIIFYLILNYDEDIIEEIGRIELDDLEVNHDYLSDLTEIVIGAYDEK